ncbi:hypothetical protein EI94DRAFT_1734266 [Lactarius quietus]|nr:hypothetical protein EI94DRAFT_1734266 [Lactarius quietus]
MSGASLPRFDQNSQLEYTETSSGGECDWLTFSSTRLYPNSFIILLGYKKRGFGAHFDFGGKTEAGETPAQAAARGLKEECSIEASLELEHCGKLLFIEIYRLFRTEDIRSQWFSATSKETETTLTSNETHTPMPYDSMCPDDVHWMPLLLSKRPFVGRADFDADSSSEYKLRRWCFSIPSTVS